MADEAKRNAKKGRMTGKHEEEGVADPAVQEPDLDPNPNPNPKANLGKVKEEKDEDAGRGKSGKKGTGNVAISANTDVNVDVEAEAEAEAEAKTEADSDPPLTMAASVVLSSLPGDAKRALREAELEADGPVGGKGLSIFTFIFNFPSLLPVFFFFYYHHHYFYSCVYTTSMSWSLKTHYSSCAYSSAFPPGIVTIRFHPIGSAPRLTQRVFKISSAQRFTSVIRFLRRKLGLRDTESVFCYVNSVFAPGLDEGVGNLWRVRSLFFSFLLHLCILTLKEKKKKKSKTRRGSSRVRAGLWVFVR